MHFEQLPKLVAPLREACQPIGLCRMLAQLLADDKLGVDQLECRIGIGSDSRVRGEQILGAARGARA